MCAKGQMLTRFKFIPRIVPTHCTVVLTKREKSCAIIFQSQRKGAAWKCFFGQNKPYPLEGGKSRRRRKRAQTAPSVNVPAALQNVSEVATKSAPATAVSASNVPSPAKRNSQFTSRGPRIAHVEQLSPEEAKEFEESLAQEKASKS